MDIFKYKDRLDQILFAIPSLDNDKTNRILERIKEYEIPVLQVPSIQDLTSGKDKIDTLKPIDINSLQQAEIKKGKEQKVCQWHLCIRK